MLQVECDATLVAVQDHEWRRNAIDARFAIAAGVVAARQLFDFDDVCSHVRQHHAAGGSGHDLRQFEHTHACQRTGVGGISLHPSTFHLFVDEVRLFYITYTACGLKCARSVPIKVQASPPTASVMIVPTSPLDQKMVRAPFDAS